MKASIITIGNEILKGRTVNTNAAEIGRLLYFSGYEVWRGIVVPDKPEDIGEAFRLMVSGSDVVVSSGGLGPTFDDITIESFAREFNLKLVLDRNTYEHIKLLSEKRNLSMTDERVKMAYIPEGASVIENKVGTAPGIYISIEKCKVFILPGVPAEMRSMLPYIGEVIKLPNSFYHEENLRVAGIYEATMAPFVTALMKKYDGKVYIKTHPSISAQGGESYLDIEVSAHSSDIKDAEMKAKKVIDELKEIAESIKSKT
ncbi:MAG: molybdopterin-binding protein [Thermoplasmatales archaeon]